MKTVLKFIHKFTKLVEHFGLKSRLVVLIKKCLIKKLVVGYGNNVSIAAGNETDI